jgi:glycosyltransferase involved in cell wall biosynthesis
MRVCMFNNLYPPVESGSSHHTATLAKMLAARGHDVAVIAAQVPGAAAHERVDGVDIHRLPSVMLPQLELAHNLRYLSFTLLPSNLRWLSHFLREQRPDVLHQHGQIFDLSLASALLAARLRLPLVNTIHTPVHHTGRVYRHLLPALDRTFAKLLVVDRANLLIAPDQTIVDYVRDRYRHPNVRLIPYGVDELDAAPERGRAIRARFGLGDAPVILSLGHVHNLRDRCDLVAAMPLVLREFPDARLLVVGDLFTQKPVELSERLGLSRSIIFTGRARHDEIGAYFAAATIEAHWLGTSLGLGIAAMEAMLAGVPVITSFDGDALGKDTLVADRDVLFVDRTSAETIAAPILRLLRDPKLRRSVGENGRRAIERTCSWPSVTLKVEAAYEELLASRARSAPRRSGNPAASA